MGIRSAIHESRFADTFYWIAFTNIQDLAHERAKAFTRAAPPPMIFTTGEVLTEYLNYFAAWVAAISTHGGKERSGHAR